ncbi:MAG: hypothetical protein L6R37_005092 [Teloschistes peruensis]|nr:MAG: hypothetical protein L6R37_005092 [Teloschistes peruensis]
MSKASPFFEPTAVASSDSLAVLHLKRDLLIPTILRSYDDEGIGYAEGKVTTTRYGNYPHTTLIGQPWGSQIKASKVDTGTRGRVGLHAERGQKRKRGGSSSSRRDEALAGDEDAGLHEPRVQTTQSKEMKAAIPADSGFCHLLPPTPEVWTASLPHRTQVVYTPDYSYVLQRLRVTPGTSLIEAGAGSGSFTHAAARAVFNGDLTDETANGHHSVPTKTSKHNTPPRQTAGKVWSFEFHEPRMLSLQQEIREHGLEDIVTITHRDVYEHGFTLPTTGSPQPPINASAIFLDLPAPWLALRHLTRAPSSPLNPSSSVHLCTFSPCIEQVQRTVSALRSLGWLDVEMVELSARRIEVRRERIGLQEEGLRGVNATPATVEEAIERLKEVEGRDRSYHHVMTVKALNDGIEAAADMGQPAEEEEYISKQQRLQNIKDRQADRKVYKEGRLVHRSESELKTHTSYLVFAVLPREWTEDDERRAQAEAVEGRAEVEKLEKVMSKRQMKRNAKVAAGGNKDLEMKMKWQLNGGDEEN